MNQDTLISLLDKTEKIEAKVDEAFYLSKVLHSDFFCTKSVDQVEEKRRVLDDYEKACALFRLIQESLTTSQRITKELGKVLSSACNRR